MSLTKNQLEELRQRYGDRAWAHALKARHDQGETLNANQVRCYRNALGLNIPAK